MSDYKDELVDIYASYDKLSEAEKSSEYQKLCEQHDEKNSPFHKFRKDIAGIKGFLEENIDHEQLSDKGQISVSLKLMQIVLKNLKNKNEEDILNYCRKLIINTYSKNWSLEQLNYFETVTYELIRIDDSKVNLKIIVKEKPVNRVVAGFKYNDHFKLIGLFGLETNSALIPGAQMEAYFRFGGETHITLRLEIPSNQ